MLELHPISPGSGCGELSCSPTCQDLIFLCKCHEPGLAPASCQAGWNIPETDMALLLFLGRSSCSSLCTDTPVVLSVGYATLEICLVYT